MAKKDVNLLYIIIYYIIYISLFLFSKFKSEASVVWCTFENRLARGNISNVNYLTSFNFMVSYQTFSHKFIEIIFFSKYSLYFALLLHARSTESERVWGILGI